MSNPKCPHCEYEFTDDDIWHSDKFPTERDGDTNEFKCPGCRDWLYVTLEITPSWSLSWSFQDEDGKDL